MVSAVVRKIGSGITCLDLGIPYDNYMTLDRLAKCSALSFAFEK